MEPIEKDELDEAISVVQLYMDDEDLVQFHGRYPDFENGLEALLQVHVTG